LWHTGAGPLGTGRVANSLCTHPAGPANTVGSERWGRTVCFLAAQSLLRLRLQIQSSPRLSPSALGPTDEEAKLSSLEVDLTTGAHGGRRKSPDPCRGSRQAAAGAHPAGVVAGGYGGAPEGGEAAGGLEILTRAWEQRQRPWCSHRGRWQLQQQVSDLPMHAASGDTDGMDGESVGRTTRIQELQGKGSWTREIHSVAAAARWQLLFRRVRSRAIFTCPETLNGNTEGLYHIKISVTCNKDISAATLCCVLPLDLRPHLVSRC
jgi:hypothetical protein